MEYIGMVSGYCIINRELYSFMAQQKRTFKVGAIPNLGVY